MSIPNLTKRCSRCRKVKTVEEFGKESAYKDGYRTQCKQCGRDYYKQYAAIVKHLTRNRPATAKPPKPEPDPKPCSKCEQIKPLEAFPIDDRSGRRRRIFRDCRLIRSNIWRNHN